MDNKVKLDAFIEASVLNAFSAEITGLTPAVVLAEIDGVTGRGVKNICLENGEIIFIMTDGTKISIGQMPVADIPKASTTSLGAVMIGKNLTIDESGRLSAVGDEKVEENSTAPISGGAIYKLIGTVEEALARL